MSRGPDTRVHEALAHGDIEIHGRLRSASNTTLRCSVTAGDLTLDCVYKPMSGERPLWDFPDWTLTRREVAAFALSEALGWSLVPATVWREDGPSGAGMCQLWIHEDPAREPVTVVRPDRVPVGYLRVLNAEDGMGNPLALVHEDSPSLARMAVFDVLANNADRKGGHVLADADAGTWAIDHGVTFAVEEKLRTVLWGWAGKPIDAEVLADVEILGEQLSDGLDAVDRWLDADEREALRSRVRRLVRTATYPLPSGRWPAVPWPVF